MRNPSQRNCGSLSDRNRLCRDTHQTSFYLTQPNFSFRWMFSLICYLQCIPAAVISYSGVFFLDLKLDTLVTATFLQSSKRKVQISACSRRPGVSQSLLCVTSNPQGIVGIQNRLWAKKKKHDHCFLISCLEVA